MEAEEVQRLVQRELFAQAQRHERELRHRDAQIFRLRLQLLKVREEEADVTVQLTEPGSIGLTVDELDDGGAWIIAIEPGEQSATHPEIQLGMRVVGVGGRACTQLPFARVVELIRDHRERPLALNLARAVPTARLPSADGTLQDATARRRAPIGAGGRPLVVSVCSSEDGSIGEGVPPITEGIPPQRR
jgi:C-terminal processing protease CtpA/Prc